MIIYDTKVLIRHYIRMTGISPMQLWIILSAAMKKGKDKEMQHALHFLLCPWRVYPYHVHMMLHHNNLFLSFPSSYQQEKKNKEEAESYGFFVLSMWVQLITCNQYLYLYRSTPYIHTEHHYASVGISCFLCGMPACHSASIKTYALLIHL